MKHCSNCRISKPEEDFYRSRGHLRSHCKPCHKGKVKERRKERGEEFKESERRRCRAKKYGMTVDEVDEFTSARGNCCESCGRHESEVQTRYGKLDIDHCHETGEVRGLLCPPCNKMLGNAQDEIARLQSGINYLERTDKRLAEANG